MHIKHIRPQRIFKLLSWCPSVLCSTQITQSLILVSIKCLKSYTSYRRKKQHQQTNRTEISSTNWLKGSIRAIENYALFHLHSILYTPLKQNQTRKDKNKANVDSLIFIYLVLLCPYCRRTPVNRPELYFFQIWFKQPVNTVWR